MVLHNTYLSYVWLETRENPIAYPEVFKIIGGVNTTDRRQTSGVFLDYNFGETTFY